MSLLLKKSMFLYCWLLLQNAVVPFSNMPLEHLCVKVLSHRALTHLLIVQYPSYKFQISKILINKNTSMN